MTADEHLSAIDSATRELVDEVNAATAAGVAPALIVPAIVTAFRSALNLPEGVELPTLPGLS